MSSPMMEPLHRAKQLALETYAAYSDDSAERLAAALAYYATFSIAPLAVLVLSIVGLLYGGKSEPAQEQLLSQMEKVIGPDGGALLEGLLEGAAAPSAGTWAAVLSGILLVIGATTLLARLREALNVIWKASPERSGLGEYLWSRGLSLALIVLTGAAVVGSLVASSVAAQAVSAARVPGALGLAWGLERALSLVVMAGLFATMYHVLPAAPVRWSDAWKGAALASILLTLGTWVLSWYLGSAPVTSAYGAAGGLVAFLVWVYYSAQVFFLGAEFSAVLARRARTEAQIGATASEPLKKESSSSADSSSLGKSVPAWIRTLGWMGLGAVLTWLLRR